MQPPKVRKYVMQDSPQVLLDNPPVEYEDCPIPQNYDPGFVAAIAPPIRADSSPANATDPTAVETIKDADDEFYLFGTPRDSEAPTAWGMPTMGDTTATTVISLFPPVASPPMNSPVGSDNGHATVTGPPLAPATQATEPGDAGAEGYYDVKRPTCSLNLVCYRSGAKGCELQQVHCVLRSRFPDDESFDKAVMANGRLVHNDVQFFNEMRRLYISKMCGPMRRYFSLKSLRAFRILAYTPTTRPTVVPFDDFVLQEMLYAYLHPQTLPKNDDWVRWVFRLRGKGNRHAVEFVEGWNTARIAVAGTIPWLSSCIVGIAWTAAGGDVQSAFT
ncbi:hypothetical protein VSDG_10149 [Cytospora chrysosperma]|nr:hypothetical protein VSDG_10149 [Valsa sordida]